MNAVSRLVGSVLIEIADEWQTEWYYFSLGPMTKPKELQSLLPMGIELLRLEPINKTNVLGADQAISSLDTAIQSTPVGKTLTGSLAK